MSIPHTRTKKHKESLKKKRKNKQPKKIERLEKQEVKKCRPVVKNKPKEWYDCVKSVLIRSYSGPYFPAFGLTPYLSAFCPNVEKYRPE